jgi:hypothetical protein
MAHMQEKASEKLFPLVSVFNFRTIPLKHQFTGGYKADVPYGSIPVFINKGQTSVVIPQRPLSAVSFSIG